MTTPTLPTQPDETLRNSGSPPYVILLRPDPVPPGAARPLTTPRCVVKDCTNDVQMVVEVWRVDPDRIARRLPCCVVHGRDIVVNVGRWTLHDRLEGPVTVTFDGAP